MALPDGVLVAWYGDDFTGSSAVLEVLAFAGVPSVLFFDIPTAAQLGRFGPLSAIGIAGTARSRPPEWMNEQLPAVFAFMASLEAQLNHYKICSTLDSSPTVGSIGRATELGRQAFPSRAIPLFAAAPDMGRYQAFGHFFASAGESVFRLDRHPVMARHPVTPIDEADIRQHVGRQTELPVGLVDLRALGSDAEADAALAGEVARGAAVIALDAMSDADLEAVGGIMWRHRELNRFIVGSQGVEYALLEHWRAVGLLDRAAEPPSREAAELVPVVSGSVSETTRQQIDWALERGFAGIVFDATAVASGEDATARAVDAAVSAALAAAGEGRDPLVYSARGPDDPSFAATRVAFEQAGVALEETNARLGNALGRVLSRVMEKTGARRAVISGGDTSSHAAQQLGVFALTAAAPTTPGAALFDAHRSADASGPSLEIALKGGQMGTPDYFGWIKRGGGAAGPARRTT